MGTRPTLRAIIVDDDAVLRGVLASLLVDIGFRIVGEADSVAGAQDVLDRQQVDVVILDLALKAGAGEDLLQPLTEEHPDVWTVVFSAYADHPDALTALGADAVFQKPDFDGLEHWLRNLTQEPGFDETAGTDRRRPTQRAPILPAKGPRSPSGLEPWLSLRAAVDGLWPGDAVMALDLLNAAEVANHGDPVFLLDHRIALARAVAGSLRDRDRIAVSPAGPIVCLLVAGHPEAPAAVFDRLEVNWDHAGMHGTPIGSFAHVRPGHAPLRTLERVLIRVADGTTTADHPLRLA